MYKDYRLTWHNTTPDENGYRLHSTRIECVGSLLPLILKRMPAGEYTIICQSDIDMYKFEEDNKMYGQLFEEAGLGALVSATADTIMYVDEKGVHEWHQIDEKHNPIVADRATYTHNYLLEDSIPPIAYYDRVDTYSVKNRVLLTDELLKDM